MDRARVALWAQRTAVVVVVAIAATFVLRVGTTSSQQLSPRDPTVWLAARSAGLLVQLNAVSGEVTARVEGAVAAGDDVSVAQSGPGALVLNRTKGELFHLDPVTQEPGQKNAVTGGQAILVSGEQARLVTATSVRSVSPDGRLGAPVSLPEALTGPTLDGTGTVWGVAAGQVVAVGDQVRLVATEGLQVAGLAAAAGQAAVVDRAGPAMITLDPGRASVAARGCLSEAPTGAIVGGGSQPGDPGGWLLAVDPGTGRLLTHDLQSGRCGVIDLEVRGAVGVPVEVGGNAYVPLRSTGEIAIVRLDRNELVQRVKVTEAGRNLEVLTKDGVVWFNDPDASTAGTVDSSGSVRAIDKLATAGAAPGSGSGITGEGAGNASGDGGTTGTRRPSGTNGSGSGSGPGTGANGGAGEDTSEGGTGDATRTGSTGTGGAGAGTGPSASGTGDDLTNLRPDLLIADFSFTSRVVDVGQEVVFADRSSGGPTAWTWDFGDGTFASGPRTTKVWRTAGTYTVTLRVDNVSSSNSATATIQVVTPNVKVRPKADFAFSQQRTEVGTPITFTDRSKGEPTELRWNFGDNTTATGATVSKTYTSSGTFVVTLVATNSEGSDSTQATIQVFERVTAPVAQIEAPLRDAQTDQGLVFVSRSSGNPTELRWNFGDGSSSVGSIARHAWGEAGVYTVTLTASNTAGSNSTSVTVTIRQAVVAPEARVTPGSATVRENEPLRLTSVSINNPTSTTWNFGDGTTGSGSSVTKAWSRAGSYTVTLRVANSAGSDQAQVPVTVLADLPPPTASFSYAPAAPNTLTPVMFTNSSTGATSWSWSFDDGTPVSTQRDPTHLFERPGTYTVSLTATNSTGSTTATRVVTVATPPPVASFSFAPATPLAGTVVAFSDTSTGGIATTWTWDFGDATPIVTTRNPTHAFALPGSYTVRLTVANAAGTSTITRIVDVSPPAPVAAFTVAPATPAAGSPVAFTNTSTGGPGATFAWTFGDGGVSAIASPTHVYAAAGTYPVTFTVTNVSGTSVATRSLVVVPPPPVPSFTFAPAAPIVGQPVTFTNTTTGGPVTSWLWEMGDGTTYVTATPPPHVYATPGPQQVRLTATNAAGSPTAVATFTVAPATPPPTVVISLVPTQGIVGQPVSFSAAITSGQAPYTYAWTFPGGAPAISTAASPSVVWAAPGGPITVTLIITDSLGRTATDTQAITVVNPPPTADFTFAPVAPLTGQTVAFTSTHTGGQGALSYLWTVAGPAPSVPATSTAANPSFVFGTAGSYSVTLVITDGLNRSSAPVTKTVVVTDPAPPPPPPPAPPPLGELPAI